MSSLYTPKYEMHVDFKISGKVITPEAYDKLVDRFPWVYGPKVEYFKELRREEEEKERLAFLLEVSHKPTTQPPTETPIPPLTPITEEPQEDHI